MRGSPGEYIYIQESLIFYHLKIKVYLQEEFLYQINIKYIFLSMNVKGGGITYVSEFRSDEMRVFRGGLRHLPQW